jgi:hypothetical protein
MPDGGRAPLPHLGRLPHSTPVAAQDHDGLRERGPAAFVGGVKMQRILRVVRVVTRVAVVAGLGRAALAHLRGVSARTKDRQKSQEVALRRLKASAGQQGASGAHLPQDHTAQWCSAHISQSLV